MTIKQEFAIKALISALGDIALECIEDDEFNNVIANCDIFKCSVDDAINMLCNLISPES